MFPVFYYMQAEAAVIILFESGQKKRGQR